MEKTCVIIKPDGVGKKLVGKIIDKFEQENFKLLGIKMLRPDRQTIEGFYAVHKGKFFFEAFLSFMLSGPIVVTAWEADNAITRVRQIIGATNSTEAAPGTLRNLYGTDNRKNLVHSSDSIENGQREVSFFFTDKELLDYNPDNWLDK